MTSGWPGKAKWSDVLDCFADRSDPLATIQRLGSEWAERYYLNKPRLVFGPHMMVLREYWHGSRIDEHLENLAVMVPALITDLKPRRLSGALVIVDFAGGRIGQIDGRCRANVWRHIDRTFEVLRICAY